MEQPTKLSKLDPDAISHAASLSIYNILVNPNIEDPDKIVLIDKVDEATLLFYRKGVQSEWSTQGDVYAPKYSTGWVVKEYHSLPDLEEQVQYLKANETNVPKIYLVDRGKPRVWMQNVSDAGYIPVRQWYKQYGKHMNKKELKRRFTQQMLLMEPKTTNLYVLPDFSNDKNVYVRPEPFDIIFLEGGKPTNSKPLSDVWDTLWKEMRSKPYKDMY